jgi:proteasome assembly chaperone (PAC2) family protein
VRDPAELYEVLDAVDLGSPVLIEALDGFVDAGHAVRLAREHLLATLRAEVVARFDVDAVLDYRARRPPLLFDTDRWVEYEQPELAIHALVDQAGTRFLMLSGPEPDTQWERFVTALLQLHDRLHVRLTIGLHGIPWAAPHTRPLGLTGHGRPRELLGEHLAGAARIQVPASAGHLLEFRLLEAERNAIGFAAHVPHYLAHVEYPAAAAALLTAAKESGGLSLGLEALHEQAVTVRRDVDAQVEQDEQAAAAIRALEEQYDSDLTPAPDEVLPTGDELGEAFEQFLAERARRDRDVPPS